VSPGRVFRGALPLFFLAALLFVSRAFLTPGKEGRILGLEEAGRLVIVIFLCHVFIRVTSAADIQRASAFFAGKKAALLMRLSFSMIPELLDTGGEILAALSCRGLSFGRRPIRALIVFTTGFARKAAAKAARTAEALEARGCGYERSSKPFSPGMRDAAALLVSAAVAAAAVVI
jgi:energy-coupling factor transporter transmembrane protein EcfT